MAIRITYFVHGTSVDNENGIASGWNDCPLSEKGRKQSIELGKSYLHANFDAVFCSDLKRALSTANLAFGNYAMVVTSRYLRECNYGDFNGKPHKLFKNKMDKYIIVPFPHGESYQQVEERVRKFLKSLEPEYQGKHIAIVSHQGPQLALEVILNRKTWEQAIAEDWRRKGKWQPGWEYVVE